MEVNEDETILDIDIANLKESFFSGEYIFIGLLEIKGLSVLTETSPLTEIISLKESIEKILISYNHKDVKICKAIGDKYILFTKYKTNEENIKGLSYILEHFSESQKEKVDFIIGLSKIEKGEMCSTIKAEIALSLAKEEDKRIFIFNEKNEKIKEKLHFLEWKEKTQKLINSKNIIPYYQPIYNINTGKIEKYEVLARGIINGEIISPFFFINHAEELGLINEVTKIIIDKSFKYFEDKEESFALTINLSEKDLADSNFISFITQAVKKYNINPERITLEILENITFSSENDKIVKQILELKELGFKLAIDDFGSDKSNFSRLLNIDIDYIKFDAIFIKNINKNERNKIIIKSMVSMAKVLNIKTIAEFVESEDILETIKECGIDYAQGYFIGKPIEKILKEGE